MIDKVYRKNKKIRDIQQTIFYYYNKKGNGSFTKNLYFDNILSR